MEEVVSKKFRESQMTATEINSLLAAVPEYVREGEHFWLSEAGSGIGGSGAVSTRASYEPRRGWSRTVNEKDRRKPLTTIAT
jgi:hypothetical protein